jgi:DNA-binding PadR family transcriptional regulator
MRQPTREQSQGQLLSGAPLYLLMSLASGDKHGHALMKDVEQFAGVHLGPGTLYKALGRLEQDGLIESLPPEERRRPYALTPAGHDALARSLDHLAGVVDEGSRRLGRKARPRVAPVQ